MSKQNHSLAIKSLKIKISELECLVELSHEASDKNISTVNCNITSKELYEEREVLKSNISDIENSIITLYSLQSV